MDKLNLPTRHVAVQAVRHGVMSLPTPQHSVAAQQALRVDLPQPDAMTPYRPQEMSQQAAMHEASTRPVDGHLHARPIAHRPVDMR